MFGVGGLLIAGVVLYITLLGIQQSQEVRGQAAGSCSESPVDVQFRVWTGKDTPWVAGDTMKLKTGDVIDVNCFAKLGSKLLTNGGIVGTVKTPDGQTVTVVNTPKAEVRKLTVTQAGTYTFICSNPTKTCTNQDGFTIAGTSTSTSTTPSPCVSNSGGHGGTGTSGCPSPSVVPQPTSAPSTGNPADLNRDGKVNILDYQLFLDAYRKAL